MNYICWFYVIFFQTHVSYFKIILASKINSANLYYYVQLRNHP